MFVCGLLLYFAVGMIIIGILQGIWNLIVHGKIDVKRKYYPYAPKGEQIKYE